MRAPVSILVIDVGTSGLRAAVVAPGRDRRARHLPRLPARHPVRRPRRVRRRGDGRRGARRRPAGPGRRRAGRGRRHHQPASVDHRVGPRHGRAGRARPSAGRTSAPSAPASSWAPRASRSRPTSRPPRWRGCSTPTTPSAARDLCFGTVDTWVAWTLSGGRPPRHRPQQRRRHRAAARRRVGLGAPTCSKPCGSPRRCCRPSWTRAGRSVRPPRWPAGRRSPRSSATSRAR